MAHSPSVIRPIAKGQLRQLIALDVSQTQTQRYAVRASMDPLGLLLERRDLDLPLHCPTWGANECRTRLELWHRNLAEGSRCFGCYVGEELAGVVLLSPLLMDGTLELFSIFVGAGHRRRGIGSMLLRQAEIEAATQRASTLHLTTTLENANAIDFYLHRGYRLVQLADRVVVPNQDAEVRFAKRIGMGCEVLCGTGKGGR